MKAVIVEQAGGVENLQLADIPTPKAQKGEVLVRVKASSINPVDTKTRKGKSLFSELKGKYGTIILGWDISGVVEKLGEGVTEFKVGDEVFGMIHFPGHGKAYAEYVTAPVDQLALKPANITHEEAAAATLAALTAWQALVTQVKIQKGARVLVRGASGGVGHYAVQMAKYLGAYVIGTSSMANKDFVLSLGADEHIDYKSGKLEDKVRDLDFVLDTIGADNIPSSIAVTKKGGTVIALPSGSLGEDNVESAKEKGISCYFFMVSTNKKDIREVAALLEKGIIHSYVSKTFTLEQAREAHTEIETGRTKGKIVFRIA